MPSDQPVYGPTLNMQAVHLERSRSVAKSYGDRFARLTAGVGAELATILEGLTYLGPLRSAPSGSMIAPTDKYKWATGDTLPSTCTTTRPWRGRSTTGCALWRSPTNSMWFRFKSREPRN